MKSFGIIMTVLGSAVGMWVCRRFTSLMGQMYNWAPPFADYEVATLVGAAVADLMLIIALICV